MVGADRVVLIAGGGPVGLAAGVELTRRGVPVRIVDAGKGPTPVEESRALGVLPTTLAVLAASGITERLIAEGQPIRRADIAWNGRKAVTIGFQSAPTSTPFILALPQGRTERAMIDWLYDRGVEVEWNTAFEDLQDTRNPTVRLSNGEEVSADAVLGCDGVHSRVRKVLDVPWTGEGFPGDFALVDVTFGSPCEPDRALIDLSTDGALAFLPFDDRHARLVGTRSDPLSLARDVPGIASVGWSSRFNGAFRHAERMARGRVFLAGDAAHVHSPVMGRGMNLGIWDAATFAFLYANGRETEYEMRRVPSVKAVLSQTRRMTALIARPPAWIGPALRYGLPAALLVPGFRRRVATRILALDLPQPEWLAEPTPGDTRDARTGGRGSGRG